MLLILGAWRHLYMRFPLRYDPAYWGAVFPLGMYTVCTHRLAGVLGVNFLLVVPRYFVYLAVVAWMAALLGLILSVLRALITTLPAGR
jgi:tellurite resistance protein TehA-like permease